MPKYEVTKTKTEYVQIEAPDQKTAMKLAFLPENAWQWDDGDVEVNIEEMEE